MTDMLIGMKYGISPSLVLTEAFGRILVVDDIGTNLYALKQFEALGPGRNKLLTVVSNSEIVASMSRKNGYSHIPPNIQQIALKFVLESALWALYQIAVHVEPQGHLSKNAYDSALEAFDIWFNSYDFTQIDELLNSNEPVAARRVLHLKRFGKSVNDACTHLLQGGQNLPKAMIDPSFRYFGVYDFEMHFPGITVREFNIYGLVDATIIFNLDPFIIMWSAHDSRKEGMAELFAAAESAHVPICAMHKTGLPPQEFSDFRRSP